MGNFVVIHNTTSQYVTEPGSKLSYTDYLEEARRFNTAIEAEQNCCGNEHIGMIDRMLDLGF